MIGVGDEIGVECDELAPAARLLHKRVVQSGR